MFHILEQNNGLVWGIGMLKQTQCPWSNAIPGFWDEDIPRLNDCLLSLCFYYTHDHLNRVLYFLVSMKFIGKKRTRTTHSSRSNIKSAGWAYLPAQPAFLVCG